MENFGRVVIFLNVNLLSHFSWKNYAQNVEVNSLKEKIRKDVSSTVVLLIQNVNLSQIINQLMLSAQSVGLLLCLSNQKSLGRLNLFA